MSQLHNVTFYVDSGDFDAVRAFYADRLGLPVVFEEVGHLCCFGAGEGLAICVHEAEPGHPAGSRELFLWVAGASDRPETRLTDPVGNRVRFHARRG